MRDAVAALVAAALIFFALSLLTSLHFYRKRHRKVREDELARGRTIIVELPTDPELTLFTEDAEHFYYGATPIDKNEIMAVRVLINGSPIAAFVSPRWQSERRIGQVGRRRQDDSFEDQLRGHPARPLGRGHRDREHAAGHDPRRVRRGARARVSGARAENLRRGQSGSGKATDPFDALRAGYHSTSGWPAR